MNKKKPTTIRKLIRYLGIMEQISQIRDKKNGFDSVKIIFPDNFIFIERLESKFTDQIHETEIPIGDIDQCIKRARDRLRYLREKEKGQIII